MANLDFSTLSAFIFDLDGVIWRGATAIAGAVESISRLQNAGKHCVYCTNNASSTPADYVEKLASLGIKAQEDDIMTSALATALYLSSQLTGQFSAYVVGEEGLVSMLRKTGARVVTMQGMNPITNDIIEDTAFPVDCVVVGIDRSFNYDKLRLAQRFIMNGARFIATNRDATFPVLDGVVPGAGAIVSAIETASGTSPLTVGKPQALMPMLLMQRFGFKAETTAFVGDRLDTDMVAAHRANLSAIFVATGISTREAAERARGQQKPDAILADLPELCHKVLGEVAMGGIENLPAMNESSAVAPTETAPATPVTVPSTENMNGGATSDANSKKLFAERPPVESSTTAEPAFSMLSDESPTEETAPAETKTPPSATPSVSPLANLLENEEPQGIEVESAPSPFAFSLEDNAGESIKPRLAPHLAGPQLSKTEAPTAPKSAAKIGADAKNEGDAKITPGTKNKEIDVSEGLDNWWESIEDAFKKS